MEPAIAGGLMVFGIVMLYDTEAADDRLFNNALQDRLYYSTLSRSSLPTLLTYAVMNASITSVRQVLWKGELSCEKKKKGWYASRTHEFQAEILPLWIVPIIANRHQPSNSFLGSCIPIPLLITLALKSTTGM